MNEFKGNFTLHLIVQLIGKKLMLYQLDIYLCEQKEYLFKILVINLHNMLHYFYQNSWVNLKRK